MPRTIRYHLDEHIAHAVAAGLRQRGIDVTTTTDAHLLGADDAAQIAHGLARGRVIFTQDDDFLALAAVGTRHAGLAYCHQNARSIGQIIRALQLLWEIYEPDEMENRIEFIYLMREPAYGPFASVDRNTGFSRSSLARAA